MFLENQNICIFGMRGSGKSTLGRRIQEFYKNVFVFDTLNEYDESDGIILNNYDEFSNFVIETSEKNNIKAIIRFSFEDSSNQVLFDEFIKLLYHRENVTIMIEEVQNFATVHRIPPYLKQASLTGRHKNVNFITTTQRIAEIHKSLLSQAHHIFSGYTDSPRDKQTLKEYGFNIEKIEYLNQFEFLWKNGRDMSVITNDLNFVENKSKSQELPIENDEIEEDISEN